MDVTQADSGNIFFWLIFGPIVVSIVVGLIIAAVSAAGAGAATLKDSYDEKVIRDHEKAKADMEELHRMIEPDDSEERPSAS